MLTVANISEKEVEMAMLSRPLGQPPQCTWPPSFSVRAAGAVPTGTGSAGMSVGTIAGIAAGAAGVALIGESHSLTSGS